MIDSRTHIEKTTIHRGHERDMKSMAPFIAITTLELQILAPTLSLRLNDDVATRVVEAILGGTLMNVSSKRHVSQNSPIIFAQTKPYYDDFYVR